MSKSLSGTLLNLGSRSVAALARRAAAALCLAGAFVVAGEPAASLAQEVEWIWSPEHAANSIPASSCYFRRGFEIGEPESGEIAIAADDAYELFINGRQIATGEGWQKLVRYDIGRYLMRGYNVIAIRVTNTRGSTAGLAARAVIKQRGTTTTAIVTNTTWKTNLRPLPLWHLPAYGDRRWPDARSWGPLGRTEPWIDQEVIAENGRFRAARDFEVQEVLSGEQTGSLIAMAFNEFGQVVASRENGPLLLIYDANRDGILDKTRVYCDKVKGCQGILPLNGEVFVVGDGPEGVALYRLTDKDRDAHLETIRAIVRFKGEPSEHGPHGVALGPDGLLYVVAGNHTDLADPPSPVGPYQHPYEGDLVGPRYEDPSGHAAGRKAPGGFVFRTDMDGSFVQVVAGGLRNAYDLAFNRGGELFTHDSDMESDEGTPWYRPTRVQHVVAGGEFGWRSGWAKWPDYFVDSLPATLETGFGSPTGLVAYDHFMYPTHFQNTLFSCDWAQGRIVAIRTAPSGASFQAVSETFLEGEPLNATDIDVGPDGWLYFVTGGRDTEGGLYRIVWKGTIPESRKNLGEGISQAILQPQPTSAWGRQRLAGVKQKMGDPWAGQLRGVAMSPENPDEYRTRALDLMQLFGPPPTKDLLLRLAADRKPAVRAKAAYLLGIHADADGIARLTIMFDDPDAIVRRTACESLGRLGQTVRLEKLVPMLVSNDRHEAWAARRLLEKLPPQDWHEVVLASDNPRVFIQGATAMMIAKPEKAKALAVLQNISHRMQGFVSDRDFIDMLRVAQLAIHRAEIAPDEAAKLAAQLSDEFPASNAIINRELIRLLVYLQAGTAVDRYVEYLESDIPAAEKVQLAMYLRYLQQGWTSESKLALLDTFERLIEAGKGKGHTEYLHRAMRDFGRILTPEESKRVLVEGARRPSAALAALYGVAAQADGDTIELLKELDVNLISNRSDAADKLRVGIIAVLAQSGRSDAVDYLREIYERDPERRQMVAMGLAQSPDGENWDYIVRTLPIIEGAAAQEVLIKLRRVERAPDKPEPFRQVILRGLKLQENGAQHAVALLEHWSGESVSTADDPWDKALASWQAWYAKKYPDAPEAALPEEKADSKWKLAELLAYLESNEAHDASPERGAAVFHKAQCAKCHRFGDIGESQGPDLSAIGKRFQQREILEAILFPSHVVPDQYASKTVVTSDGRAITGIVARGTDGTLSVLQADAHKVTLRADQVEQMLPSRKSAMPEGLLDPLTAEEIADLMTYLRYPPGTRLTRQPASAAPK